MLPDADKYQTGDPRVPADISEGIIISPDTKRSNRIPPNQSRTRKWPVLHASVVPRIDLDQWKLEVFGLVEQPLSFTWSEFQELPRVQVFADFHCVTQWSRLDNVWSGVSIHDLLSRAKVKPTAKYVVAHAYDHGWTTNLPLAELVKDDVLIADLHDGKPLSADHGGPVRLMVPQLYAWKSAKWLRAIELVAEDHPGYWERCGYHNLGDPWREQRYS